MKVKDLMIREVTTCSEDDDLNRAAQIMWEVDCGTVPVVDGGQVRGMITDRDVCMAAYTTGRRLSDLRVRHAMSRDVVTCAPDDTVEAALATMKRARVRRLPVTDRGGKLVGILSMNDLAREAAREVESGSRASIAPDLTTTLGTICEPTKAAPPVQRGSKSAGALLGARA